MPLSPSRITGYQPRGGDAMWTLVHLPLSFTGGLHVGLCHASLVSTYCACRSKHSSAVVCWSSIVWKYSVQAGDGREACWWETYKTFY